MAHPLPISKFYKGVNRQSSVAKKEAKSIIKQTCCHSPGDLNIKQIGILDRAFIYCHIS